MPARASRRCAGVVWTLMSIEACAARALACDCDRVSLECMSVIRGDGQVITGVCTAPCETKDLAGSAASVFRVWKGLNPTLTMPELPEAPVLAEVPTAMRAGAVGAPRPGRRARRRARRWPGAAPAAAWASAAAGAAPPPPRARPAPPGCTMRARVSRPCRPPMWQPPDAR